MGSAKWWGVTTWYIDPAQTHGGSDENSGLTSGAPIKSIAEFRRRMRGADLATSVTINALSSSTNLDDGLFYGFTTRSSAVVVTVVSTPVLVFSGTITTYQAYSGNTRGSIIDSSIASSWTASGGITSSSGSRYIRKSGTGTRPYAPLIKDLASKTVQFGVASSWDETNTSAVTSTESNFTNGDSYEVVSLLTWPIVQTRGINVRLQCFDIYSTSVSLGAADVAVRYVLCGLPSQASFATWTIGTVFYNCVFSNPSGYVGTGFGFVPVNSSFLSTVVELSSGGGNGTGTNVFVASELRLWHSINYGSLFGLRFYDASSCLSIRHNSTARIESLAGSSNTGSLVTVNSGGIAYGVSSVTATTSQGSPYTVAGVNVASAPSVNATTGDAIYS